MNIFFDNELAYVYRIFFVMSILILKKCVRQLSNTYLLLKYVFIRFILMLYIKIIFTKIYLIFKICMCIYKKNSKKGWPFDRPRIPEWQGWGVRAHLRWIHLTKKLNFPNLIFIHCIVIKSPLKARTQKKVLERFKSRSNIFVHNARIQI